MTQKIYTVAILGCGARGCETYGDLMAQKPDVYKIVALCDVNVKKLEKYVDKILLNFEESQKALDSYDNGYMGMGIFFIAAGIILFIYMILSSKLKSKEKARRVSAKKQAKKRNYAYIRHADFGAKSRILLEANTEGYSICYRRVKHTNELIVNGKVYDEMKGVLEVEHNLVAVVDGHRIEAGLDEDSCSYIYFDDVLVEIKDRRI